MPGGVEMPKFSPRAGAWAAWGLRSVRRRQLLGGRDRGAEGGSGPRGCLREDLWF